MGVLEQPGHQCMECAVGNVLFAVPSVWRGLGLRAAPRVPQPLKQLSCSWWSMNVLFGQCLLHLVF